MVSHILHSFGELTKSQAVCMFFSWYTFLIRNKIYQGLAYCVAPYHPNFCFLSGSCTDMNPSVNAHYIHIPVIGGTGVKFIPTTAESALPSCSIHVSVTCPNKQNQLRSWVGSQWEITLLSLQLYLPMVGPEGWMVFINRKQTLIFFSAVKCNMEPYTRYSSKCMYQQ